jgi:hypothetical protein
MSRVVVLSAAMKKLNRKRISPQVTGVGRVLKESEDLPYDIIPKNAQTGNERIRVATVKGKTEAERALRYHDSKLDDDEKDAGWHHYARRSTNALFNRVMKGPKNPKPGTGSK